MKLAPNTRQQAKRLLNELIDMHMTIQLKECGEELQDIIDKEQKLRWTRRVTDAAALLKPSFRQSRRQSGFKVPLQQVLHAGRLSMRTSAASLYYATKG